MTALLHSIQDTRSPIAKMSRQELMYLARYENREDIVAGMPGDLIRRKFLDNPPSVMPRPVRGQLGKPGRFVVPPYEQWKQLAFAQVEQPQEQTVEETDALSNLEKQWLASQAAETDFAELPFWKLKQECKVRGIKFARTDNKAALLGKLNGHENAA